MIKTADVRPDDVLWDGHSLGRLLERVGRRVKPDEVVARSVKVLDRRGELRLHFRGCLVVCLPTAVPGWRWATETVLGEGMRYGDHPRTHPKR